MDGPGGSQGSEGEDRGRHSVQDRSTGEQDAIHQEVFDGSDLASIVVIVLSGPEPCAIINSGIGKRTTRPHPSTRFGRRARPRLTPS